MSPLSHVRQRAAVAAQRFRNETGQVLVLTSILVPILLIPIGAFAVDIGHWYALAKRAQNTADAAALAAAHELPSSVPGPADTVGRQYVTLNYPGVQGSDVDVVTPYDGDPSKVEVTVRITSGTFFGRVIGISSLDIERRAVAEKYTGSGNMAIFSHDDSCSEGLEFNGQNHSINGLVHSNGEYLINNGGTEPFWAADGTRVDCGASVNPHNSARFGGDGYNDPNAQTLPRELAEELPWPVWYTPGDFGWHLSAPNALPWDGSNRCTFKALKIEVKSNQVVVTSPNRTINFSGGVIPSAIYCATESFIINADNLTGTLTALAPEIKVDGNNIDLTPAASNDVLFFTVPNNDNNPLNDGSYAAGGNPTCSPNPAKEMILNGNSHQWAGTIFSPCGRILINVGGSSVGSPALVGTIIGEQVKVNGRDFVMVGHENFTANIQLALVE